jgi:hypothetical protein
VPSEGSAPSCEGIALLRRLRDDESGWLERLAKVPEQARRPFVRALATAAALDADQPKVERDLLGAASRRLGSPPGVSAVSHHGLP